MIMERMLRKVLTKNQWKRLFSEGALFRQRPNELLDRALLLMIKALPDRDLLNIKEHLNVVRKMDYKRLDIFLNIDSHIEYDTRLHSCEKEAETIDWIATFFKEGDIFFDIGANVGAYSLVASKFYNGKIMIYAFEPGFANFVQLCKNILLNGCQESHYPSTDCPIR
jgi:hypothetical protein